METITADDPQAQSADVVAGNIAALKGLFPEAFVEGKVDFDVLKQLLGAAVDQREEKYGLTWHGKRSARRLALTPSLGTLRPCPEESVDWDTTQNLMIEGDNLEVLKLLQKSYAGKVKLIYIDPPYNTGKDFIYPDDYQDSIKNYLMLTGQIDSDGRTLVSNPESSGRFHTEWLNMIYPRLKVARGLMAPDGIICISIDDHEVHNLRMLCDDVFFPENFLAQFAWRTDGNFDNQAKIKSCHEYILMYARDAEAFPHPPVIDPSTPQDSKLYRPEIRNTIVKNGPRNPVSGVLLPKGFPADFKEGTICARSNKWPNYDSDVRVQGGKLVEPVTASSGWSSKELLEDFISNDCQPIQDGKGQETTFLISGTGAIEAVKKRTDQQSHVISVIGGVGGAQKAGAEVQELGIVFEDYPKPTALIQYFIRMNMGSDFLVFDFFAGSGTTGQAVIAQNAVDGGNRRFVLVQLPQKLDPEEPRQRASAGFCDQIKCPRSIAELTKERLRRAAKKVTQDYPLFKGDTGFRVFKLDSSNIEAWQPKRDDLPGTLVAHTEHLKAERTDNDILYELLLKLGLDLAVPIEQKAIAGKTVHSVGAGALIVCLDKKIGAKEVEPLALGIAKWHEEQAPAGETALVFRDSAFADDVAKTNLTAILQQHGLSNVRSI